LFKRVNPHPFLRSLGVGSAVYLFFLFGLWVTVGVTDYEAGEWFASIALIPGLATGLLLRSRNARWSVWKIAVSVVCWSVLVNAVTLLGDAGDSSTPGSALARGPELVQHRPGQIVRRDAPALQR
jgi:hypothetical protein